MKCYLSHHSLLGLLLLSLMSCNEFDINLVKGNATNQASSCPNVTLTQAEVLSRLYQMRAHRARTETICLRNADLSAIFSEQAGSIYYERIGVNVWGYSDIDDFIANDTNFGFGEPTLNDLLTNWSYSSFAYLMWDNWGIGAVDPIDPSTLDWSNVDITGANLTGIEFFYTHFSGVIGLTSAMLNDTERFVSVKLPAMDVTGWDFLSQGDGTRVDLSQTIGTVTPH